MCTYRRAHVTRQATEDTPHLCIYLCPTPSHNSLEQKKQNSQPVRQVSLRQRMYWDTDSTDCTWYHTMYMRACMQHACSGYQVSRGIGYQVGLRILHACVVRTCQVPACFLCELPEDLPGICFPHALREFFILFFLVGEATGIGLSRQLRMIVCYDRL